MIDRIVLKNVIPHYLREKSPTALSSDVWGQDLVIERDKSYLILAESGRGKTSLCSFLYGTRQDFEGAIAWQDSEGQNVMATLPRTDIWKESISIMFQSMQLFPELSAVNNVLLKNALTDYRSEKVIRQQLSELGLATKLDTPVGQLSMGQQQRVAFVRLICQPADFCLLDEPISHLDMDNAHIMCDMLKEWQNEEHCGIIVTSIGHTLPYPYDYTWNL